MDESPNDPTRMRALRDLLKSARAVGDDALEIAKDVSTISKECLQKAIGRFWPYPRILDFRWQCCGG